MTAFKSLGAVAAGEELMTYLMTLFSAAPEATFVEMRARVPRGMSSVFVASSDLERVGTTIRRCGAQTDVYVGVGARVRERGTAADVPLLAAAWADCDTTEAMDALVAFWPAPSMVVCSGSGRHAYWMLRESANADEVVAVNRRLAAALKADTRATDAARILRPPGTFNFKRDEPSPVFLERASADCVELESLRQVLIPDAVPSRPPRPRLVVSSGFEDVLRTIPAQLYVEALTGEEVGHDGKIRCPFHDDRTPSLHVYDTGWFCFGCQRGGTIIDFASQLYRLEPRGSDFFEIRRRLAADLRA